MSKLIFRVPFLGRKGKTNAGNPSVIPIVPPLHEFVIPLLPLQALFSLKVCVLFAVSQNLEPDITYTPPP